MAPATNVLPADAGPTLGQHPCTWDGCGHMSLSLSKHTIHVRKHTGERPFHCEVIGCLFAGTSKCNLVRHARSHTGERPFACGSSGCTYANSDRSNLVRHMKREHQ